TSVIFFSMTRHPHISTLFPYTTLFRSHDTVIIESFDPIFLYHYRKQSPYGRIMYDFAEETTASKEESQEQLDRIPWLIKQSFFRSEEHTSELQSRENLVCRLLLEKKKK